MYQIEQFLRMISRYCRIYLYAMSEWPLAEAANIEFGNPRLLPLLSARDPQVVLSANIALKIWYRTIFVIVYSEE